MRLTALALAAALSLPAAASIAQEANTKDMMHGMNMLATNAQMALDQYGIKANAMNLSLGQLALIARVLTDPDADDMGNNRKSTIEFIVGM